VWLVSFTTFVKWDFYFKQSNDLNSEIHWILATQKRNYVYSGAVECKAVLNYSILQSIKAARDFVFFKPKWSIIPR